MRIFTALLCTCLLAIAAWAGSAKSDPTTGQTSDGLNTISAPALTLEIPAISDLDALQNELDELFIEAEYLKYSGGNDAAVWTRIYEIQSILEPRTENGNLDEGGETCESAFVINSLPFCDTGNTSDNVNDYAPNASQDCSPEPPGGTGKDVVYVYTPTENDTISVSLCGSSFDTYLHIYAGCPGSPNSFLVCCNDDHAGTCPSGTNSLRSCCPEVELIAGFTYYIVVDGWRATSAGNYQIHITREEHCGPCPVAPVGRCCYITDNGNTGCSSNVTEDWCVQAEGEWLEGASCTSHPCPLPPCVECPAGAYISTEPVCFNGYVDQTNAGCITGAAPLLESVTCNSIVCGTAGSYHSATGQPRNDQDWYRFNVTAAQESLVVCFKGAAAGSWALYGITGPNPCGNNSDFFLQGNGTFPACQIVCPGWCVPPGEYWLGIAFANGTPCGTQYRIDIQCLDCPGAPPLGRCCYVTDAGGPGCADGVTEGWCLQAQGQWLEGASCTSDPCEPPLGRCCYVSENQPLCANDVTRDWCAAVQGGWVQGATCASACCVIDFCRWPIILPSVYEYTNLESTCCAADAPWCVGEFACNSNNCYPAAGAIIYKFTLASPGTVNLYASGPTDNQLMVFTDCDDPQGTCVASADNATDGIGNTYQGATEQILGLSLPAGTYYVATSTFAWSDSPCGIITLTIDSDVPLPAELTSFDAVAGNEQVTLNWATASETNMDRFELMRDGMLVAQVPAQNSATGANYSWTDVGLSNGTTYGYALVSVDLNGASETIASESAAPNFEAVAVTEYAMYQNYPNPFNPETSITFDIVETGLVRLAVYNALGQTVALLVDGVQSAGRHSVTFRGDALTSGLYFYKLDAGDFTTIRKMILMK